ncbi:MAG: MerR family transcriptional regulator [Bacillus sp. (in: firmicutes)]
MKKSEILNNTILEITDSKLRNYIRLGLITSVRSGLGYGKGVLADYPDNTIEVLQKIEEYKNMRFQLKDIIFLLFCDGYLVDIDKLKEHLITHSETMLSDIQFMIGKLAKKDLIEWAINSYLEKEVRMNQPGRRSNEQTLALEDKRQFEKQKIEYGFQFMTDFFQKGEIGKSSLSLFKFLGYQKEIKATIPNALLSKENWIKNISNSSEADLKQIFKIINLTRYYYKFFLDHGHESAIYTRYIFPLKTVYTNAAFKNFFQDPELIKLFIIILILEPTWRKNLLNLMSLNDHVKNYEDIEVLMPLVLDILDGKLIEEGNNTING